MFKFNRLVCVVLVCALAGLAYSKAVKSKDLTAAGLGVDVTPDADGMIIMAHHDSATPATEVQIKATGLAPHTTYGVQVHPGFTDVIAFTTSASGNATYHNTIDFPYDLTAYMAVRIFEWDGLLTTIGEVSHQELRAYGCVADTCLMEYCTTEADCDSGFDCILDTCEGGLCFHEQNCDDGDPCTHDYCSNTGCFYPPACADNDPCTTDVCTGEVDEYGNAICEFIPIANCP